MSEKTPIIKDLISLVHKAGKEVMNIYEGEIQTQLKEDRSPLTQADIKADNVILAGLYEDYPNIPTISEESYKIGKIPNLEDSFFLVDPIDGTYDYINNLEEFTINAGLIINNKPVAGLINAPAKKRMFYSYEKGSAFELSKGKTINLSSMTSKKSGSLKFISYSNKVKPEIQKIYDDLGVKENIKMKSSLKFCVVASREYDGYVAEPRAYEWDIAAGHTIVKNAGGIVTTLDEKGFKYGKSDYKNLAILVRRSKNLER